MLKALLIVTVLSSGNPLTTASDYTVEMPDMKSCLTERISILKQDESVKVLCIPRNDNSQVIGKWIKVFADELSCTKKESSSAGGSTNLNVVK